MLSNKRIAFVANTSWSIYKFRLPLLHAFVASGATVYVLAPRDRYTDAFASIPGVSFVELKMMRSKSISVTDDLRLYHELRQHYRRLQPELIFHYTIKANVYGALAAAKTGCRSVSVITGLGYMFAGKPVFRWAASVLYRYAMRKAKQVWFLNQDDRLAFTSARLVSEHKTFILPGEGVDPNIFYPSPFQLSNSPVSFLLVARLIKHKGIQEFVEAARILRSKNLNAQFFLLGFAEHESPVAIPAAQLQQWQSEGNIVYLGETDNVVEFIDRCNCVVLPSYREGMPLSLLEGASMCKALIATDTAGCRDIVRHGQNGFLCRPQDAADLASKMEAYYMLAPEAKHAMGLAGRQRVLQEYSIDKVIAIYIQRAKDLLS